MATDIMISVSSNVETLFQETSLPPSTLVKENKNGGWTLSFHDQDKLVVSDFLFYGCCLRNYQIDVFF